MNANSAEDQAEATFKSMGGAAETGTGGDGGSVYFDIYGDVKVSQTGSADVSFTVPSYTPDYGDNKLTISEDTDILFDPEPAEGDIYIKDDATTNLYFYTGGQEYQATGLQIVAGVTVTLPEDNTTISLPNSVLVQGTLTTYVESQALAINAGEFLWISSSGKVTTKPTTAATAGGAISLDGGFVMNKGTIDAGGSAATAAAAAGGAAGAVTITSDAFIYNTGSVLAKGGASSAGAGGAGAAINMTANSASLFSSGTIDASGGNGGSGVGGVSGAISLYAGDDDLGYLLIGGRVTANGGQGTGGNGGNANSIYLESNGGKLWVNAVVSVMGGASTTAAGGNGMNLTLYSNYGEDYEYGNYVETRGIKLSGTINLSGGDGVTGGGDGGQLYIENNFSDYGDPPVPAAQMVGFASLNMRGGDGADGGVGGYYYIYTYDWWTADDYYVLPVGYIVNEVPASMRGGAGDMTTGTGGNGGYVDFDTENDYYHDGNMKLTNSGALDVSGGNGNTGGDGGWVYFYGYDGVTNSASILAKGGTGTSAGGAGMAGGNYVEFSSSFNIVNSGTINGNGGNGETPGDCEGYIYMYAGGRVKNSGALKAAGGNATAGSNGDGGAGGYIELFSESTYTSNSGSLSVSGGAGDGTGDNGEDGMFWIDVLGIT